MNGHVIPNGTLILPQYYSVMKSDPVFEVTEVFRPERFLADDGKSLNKVHLTAYTPNPCSYLDLSSKDDSLRNRTATMPRRRPGPHATVPRDLSASPTLHICRMRRGGPQSASWRPASSSRLPLRHGAALNARSRCISCKCRYGQNGIMFLTIFSVPVSTNEDFRFLYLFVKMPYIRRCSNKWTKYRVFGYKAESCNSDLIIVTHAYVALDASYSCVPLRTNGPVGLSERKRVI